MKRAFNIIAIFLTSFLTALMHPGGSYAFHGEGGGVGYCSGCHILHKSEDIRNRDSKESPGTRSVTRYLRGSDPSSTCLRCHGEQGRFYNIFSRDGSAYTPGGDFYWLKKSFCWNKRGRNYRSIGDDHGHNVVALDYRLLGGTGYSGGSQASGLSFRQSVPVAVADPLDWSETDSHHAAYGEGMSEWCGNCHAGFLDSSTKHPSGKDDKLTGEIASNYNSYVKTGDITGSGNTTYLALVPFEVGTGDISLLDTSSRAGPGPVGGANVMCLTCHRAHASAFQDIGRWDFNVTYMADSHPREGDGGVSGNDVLNSYYGRNMISQFGKYQRQLCNKCHMKD